MNNRMNSKLFDSAIKANDMELVQNMIQNYYSKIVNDAYWLTLAVRCGHLNIVKYFIDIGIPTDECYSNIARAGGGPRDKSIIINYPTPVKASNDEKIEVRKYLISKNIWPTPEYIVRWDEINFVKWFVSMGIMVKHEMLIDKEIHDFLDNEYESDSSDDSYNSERNDIIDYLVSVGCWSVRLNPYDYISVLNERHLAKITDQTIQKIIRNKRRRYDYSPDLLIVCQSL